MKIDVNVDAGESFGRYILGNDEELLKHVTSANVATGFHAGDPLVMEQTILWAKNYGVAVGAHFGFEDKKGFGRRPMKITPDELRTDLVYQLGALDGFLRYYGMEMQHVKPHGAINRVVSETEEYIDVFLDTIKAYNPNLYIMLPEYTPAYKRGLEKGLKMAGEVYIDLSYDEGGNWILERNKKARTPEEVAERALSVARDKYILSMNGKKINTPEAVTVCVHGDGPNAVDIAQKVKEKLEANQIALSNFVS